MKKLLWRWFGVIGLAIALAGCGQTTQDLAAPPDAATAEARAPVVTTQVLGTFGATYSNAYGINNRGQVVGVKGSTDFSSAFVWDNGTVIDPGSFGGNYTQASAINNRGQVVGESYVPNTGFHAFLWSAKDGMEDLGTFGGPNARAFDINDHGQVGGTSQKFDPNAPAFFLDYAFVWTKQAGMVRVGGTDVQGINNRGQMVGGGGLWNTPTDLVVLGTLGGFSTSTSDINDRGQVVGYSSTTPFPFPSISHAFIWTARNGMKDLGTLGGTNSYAYAINNQGEVVGSSETATGELHAFFWSESTGMIDLTPNGGDNNVAYDINDRSQVVGYTGTFAGAGQDLKATLWTIR